MEQESSKKVFRGSAPVLCPKCGSSEQAERAKGPHVGVYCASCDKWLAWKAKPLTIEDALAFKMPYGKHKDVVLADLPDDYLDWLYEHCGNERIAERARLVFESRGSDRRDRG